MTNKPNITKEPLKYIKEPRRLSRLDAIDAFGKRLHEDPELRESIKRAGETSYAKPSEDASKKLKSSEHDAHSGGRSAPRISRNKPKKLRGIAAAVALACRAAAEDSELGRRLEEDVGAAHGESATPGEARQSPDAVENVTKRRKISEHDDICLLYTSPSPRDRTRSRMPSSA